MSLFSIIKRNAKSALSNYWGRAMGVMLIPFIASAALSAFIWLIAAVMLSSSSFFASLTIPGAAQSDSFSMIISQNSTAIIMSIVIILVYFAISAFVIGPLTMGSYYWHLQLVRGNPKPVGSIFYFFESFKKYRRAIWLQIHLGIRKFLWSIVFFVVPGLMLGGSSILLAQFGSPFDTVTLPQYRLIVFMAHFISFVVLVLAFVFYLAYTNKYNLAVYLICEDKTMTVRGALRQSINYTKGYRFSLFKFSLSFILWFIVSAIILPISLYSSPYYSASMALYSLYIIETKRREQPVVVNGPQDMDERESASAEIITAPVSHDVQHDLSDAKKKDSKEVWNAGEKLQEELDKLEDDIENDS